MDPQLLAQDILNKIIYENVPFSLGLKQAFKRQNVSKEEKATVSAIVGCALRHFLVLERIIKDAYPEISDQAMLSLIVAICNILFIKRIDVNESLKFGQSSLKDEDVPFETFITPYLDNKKLVPSEIEVGSFAFLSYRYNTPLPIIKMWHKQYGPISLNKILKANSKPGPVAIRINNNRISDEQFFNTYPDFEPTDLGGTALYHGKDKIKNLPLYERKEGDVISPAYKVMLDEIDVDLLRGVAIYSETPNDVLSELNMRFEKIFNIEYIAGNYGAYLNAKNTLNKNNLSGVNVYEASASSIVTCLSKKVHTFIVLPENSHFNLLQMLPDYFLRFDINNLDNLIAHQKEVLNEASEQIEEDGYLLYFVDTLSKKESTHVINEFLNEHPAFTLVREKQFFPFKKFGGSYFFAILKKEREQHD